jgi:hypothetical protein
MTTITTSYAGDPVIFSLNNWQSNDYYPKLKGYEQLATSFLTISLWQSNDYYPKLNGYAQLDTSFLTINLWQSSLQSSATGPQVLTYILPLGTVPATQPGVARQSIAVVGQRTVTQPYNKGP